MKEGKSGQMMDNKALCQLHLGIDIGTTSISMVIYDAIESTVIESVTIANPGFISSAQAWERIQNPALILDCVMEKLNALMDKYQEIEAIGLTGQMHGILYTDSLGEAVSPLYTWQDERGNLIWKNGLSLVEYIHAVTGLEVAAGYGLVTHIWLCEHHLCPENGTQICTIADYLGMRLTGRQKPLLHTSNAASLGFFDAANGVFFRESIQELGYPVSCLPDVTSSLEVLGHYRGIPVTIAIGDNQASYAGAVSGRKHAVLLNVGTGSQISVEVDRYLKIPGIETRPYLNGSYLLAGAALCGGRAYAVLEQFFREWARILGVPEQTMYGFMERAAEETMAAQALRSGADVGAGNLTVRTTFQGTRQEPQIRGLIENMDTGNFTPGNLILGFIRGILEEMVSMYRLIKENTELNCTELIASGNGMRQNPVMRRMAEELFGMRLTLSEFEEEAALGAARLAVHEKVKSGSLTDTR